MNMNMSKGVKTIRLQPDASGWTVAAGMSDVNSDIIDMQGFEGVRFIIGFGAIVAGGVTTIEVQQGAAASMSDAADLLGTSITIADTDDNQIAITDIFRPRERYLRLGTRRATQNSTIDFVIAELYGAHKQPITEDTATVVSTAEVHVSPADGTA